MSWVALFVALALGRALLRATGWSIDFAVDDLDLWPTMWSECPRVDVQAAWVLIGLGLLAVGGLKPIGRARPRGGWWQIGLWAGFFVIVDALLMFQYLRYMLPAGCD